MPGESKVCLSLWGGLTGWHFIPLIPPALRKELSLHFHVKRPANMLPMKFPPMHLQAKTCGKVERSCTPGWEAQTLDQEVPRLWSKQHLNMTPKTTASNSEHVPICMKTPKIIVDSYLAHVNPSIYCETCKWLRWSDFICVTTIASRKDHKTMATSTASKNRRVACTKRQWGRYWSQAT